MLDFSSYNIGLSKTSVYQPETPQLFFGLLVLMFLKQAFLFLAPLLQPKINLFISSAVLLSAND